MLIYLKCLRKSSKAFKSRPGQNLSSIRKYESKLLHQIAQVFSYLSALNLDSNASEKSVKLYSAVNDKGV